MLLTNPEPVWHICAYESRTLSLAYPYLVGISDSFSTDVCTSYLNALSTCVISIVSGIWWFPQSLPTWSLPFCQYTASYPKLSLRRTTKEWALLRFKYCKASAFSALEISSVFVSNWVMSRLFDCWPRLSCPFGYTQGRLGIWREEIGGSGSDIRVTLIICVLYSPLIGFKGILGHRYSLSFGAIGWREFL